MKKKNTFLWQNNSIFLCFIMVKCLLENKKYQLKNSDIFSVFLS